MGDYSLSDIAAASGDNFGGSGFFWIFALLLLPMLSGGGMWGNNTASKEDVYNSVQRSTDFSAIERQMNEGVAATRQGVYDTTNALKDASYNNLSEIRDLQTSVNTGFSNMQNCCCETNRNIDSVRYDMSNFNAQTRAAIHSEGEQTRAMLQQNKIEALQARINSLELAQATATTVKYPTQSTWSMGSNPYCGCNPGF